MISELVLRDFDCGLEFIFFSVVISAFQLFIRKLCLQFTVLRMRNFGKVGLRFSLGCIIRHTFDF